jgi:hypothetical protein
LKRAAGDDIDKLKVAGLIMMCRDKCWKDFLAMRDPLTGWAMDVLAEWVQDGDGAPDELREWKKKREQERLHDGTKATTDNARVR